MSKSRPRLIVNWGKDALFTEHPYWEIGTNNRWQSYQALKRDSPNGFIMHYPHPNGSYVAFHWYVPDKHVATAKRNIRKRRRRNQ